MCLSYCCLCCPWTCLFYCSLCCPLTCLFYCSLCCPLTCLFYCSLCCPLTCLFYCSLCCPRTCLFYWLSPGVSLLLQSVLPLHVSVCLFYSSLYCTVPGPEVSGLHQLVLHLDVSVQQQTCAVPGGVWLIQQLLLHLDCLSQEPVLHLSVYKSFYAAPGRV